MNGSSDSGTIIVLALRHKAGPHPVMQILATAGVLNLTTTMMTKIIYSICHTYIPSLMAVNGVPSSGLSLISLRATDCPLILLIPL